MTTSLTIGRRTAVLVSAGIALALTGCANLKSASDNIDASTSETQSMTLAEKDAMRAECETMQASMMEKMAEGGMMQGGWMMQGDGMASGHMMSPEMKAQHKACMDTFPEMKAEMRAKCETHMADGMGQGMMDHGAMSGSCPMMKPDTNTTGDQQ